MAERDDEAPVGECITISGIVQGVGFRPFVYRLALRLGVRGTVSNRGDRVEIHAGASPPVLSAFVTALSDEAPPLARIDAITRETEPSPQDEGFRIIESGAGTVSVGVVPDIATCPDCRAEMADPTARRFRYAFTNCTNCGPRFSIVTGLPYDRPATTMAPFVMCPACATEYGAPADRRFHAQPIACPACGPRLWLEGDETVAGADAVTQAATLLRQGGILAVKGLGGFHLACDATNAEAVVRLRQRKRRPTKPLAVMADAAGVKRLCQPEPQERAALHAPSAPIVLMPLRADAELAPGVAPGQAHLGVMLPYTPLHDLLIQAVGRPLVMTSGNGSGTPQAIADDEARATLSGIADGFLMADRAIARRLDDSVVRVVAGRGRVLRRGRGLAPMPLRLPEDFDGAPPVLALGAELKSAICLTHGAQALLSHHLGDLDEPGTRDAFEVAIADHEALFSHSARIIAVDPHPGYRATQLGQELAQRRGVRLEEVQHHHAHMAATMAEAGWRRDAGPVVAIVLDGLGLGADGTLWGAEILVGDYVEAHRAARLTPIALAGGDVASREPWRVLLAHLDQALGRAEVDRAPVLRPLFAGKPVATLRAMIDKGLNAPLASSAGRLFDAASALLGLAPDRLSHEGEAAMALEARAADSVAPYILALRPQGDLLEIDPAPLWHAMVADLAGGRAVGEMAGAFHAGLALAFVEAAEQVARRHALTTMAVSGGVFQNARVLQKVLALLQARGLTALAPAEVPANDGGLALGQAVVAAARARVII